MKLGSLFDGSGGFPLAGVLCGVEPVWASEIESYPIKVTSARFPHMKHLGDVQKINGAEIEPVDIITFGSPCQDLSVAGARAGLHRGERSNLFFEAISVDLKKSNPRMFFSVGEGKEELARDMLGRLPYNIYENKPHPTATNFCFTSKEFYSLIAEAGIGAANKRVPPYAFQMPFNLQKALLDGYISGDGYIRKRGRGRELSCCTSSRELSYGIARLIRNVYRVPVGVSTGKQGVGCINGREIRPNYLAYTLYAYPDSPSRVEGDMIWQPVKSVEELPGKRTVYNLSVLEDNTYAVNNITVHNCGAFSSNKGEDFRAVLQAFCGVCDETVSVPRPGKWLYAGAIVGDSYSVAWRVYDAQYWGVPQRRRRVYLIADFRGECAGEVLFKPESVLWHPTPSGGTWETASRPPEEGTGSTVNCVLASSAVNAEMTGGDISPTLLSRAGTGGNQLPLINVETPNGTDN